MTATLLGHDLATTGDPEELVPGSIRALFADADALDRRAGELRGLAEEVRRRRVETWFGRGARRWAELRPVLADGIAGAGAAYEVAARALRAQAGAIIRARAIAVVAVRLWREADAAEATVPVVGLACVVAAPPRLLDRTAPAPDPTGLRTTAEELLAAARDAVASTAADVAALLDRLCEGLPDGRFRLGELVGGLGDWCAGMWHLSWTLSPAHWALDREAAEADLEQLMAGAVEAGRTLAADPHEANRLLLDSQLWHDNPGRWIGQATPDALLTAAGGVGVATRTGSRLAAALRVADTVTDAPPPTPRWTPRIWMSKDPLVGELATRIDAEFPGHLRRINETIPRPGGRQEVDIDLGTVGVEVKSGRARSFATQIERVAAVTGRPTFGYAPDIPFAALADARRRGVIITTTEEELFAILRELL